eukprot:scaffold225_cov388-Prasinococcus_capsulatus_cf.AAC.37
MPAPVEGESAVLQCRLPRSAGRTAQSLYCSRGRTLLQREPIRQGTRWVQDVTETRPPATASRSTFAKRRWRVCQRQPRCEMLCWRRVARSSPLVLVRLAKAPPRRRPPQSATASSRDPLRSSRASTATWYIVQSRVLTHNAAQVTS